MKAKALIHPTIKERPIAKRLPNLQLTHEERELFLADVIAEIGLKPNPSENNPLSEREMICMIILNGAGQRLKQFEALLGIKADTIQKHEKNIRRKLNAINRSHAFYLALAKNYLQWLPQKSASDNRYSC